MKHYEISNRRLNMVKKLFILMLSGTMLFSLIGCINNYEEYEKTSSESIEDEYATEQRDIENNIPMQEEKPELPDSLFFMRNFDYVMNDDGTYSFVGYITDCKMSAYSLSSSYQYDTVFRFGSIACRLYILPLLL